MGQKNATSGRKKAQQHKIRKEQFSPFQANLSTGFIQSILSIRSIGSIQSNLSSSPLQNPCETRGFPCSLLRTGAAPHPSA